MWAASARAAGFRTGNTPEVGAIACWDNGGYGHVAVVTEVEHDQKIQVKEANYNGNRTINNFRGWFDPTNVVWERSAISIQIKEFLISRKGTHPSMSAF